MDHHQLDILQLGPYIHVLAEELAVAEEVQEFL